MSTKRNLLAMLAISLCIAAPAYGQFTVTEAGPIDSAGAIGDADNGSFSATFGGPSTLFTSIDFSGDLTDVVAGTFASEADFNITSIFGLNANFGPSTTGGFTGPINVSSTLGGLFFLESGDTLNFESFESFDDGAGADATWNNIDFTFDNTFGGGTSLGTFLEGSFTIDTEGSDFDTELGLYLDDGTLIANDDDGGTCLLYTSPSPRDQRGSRMPSSA